MNCLGVSADCINVDSAASEPYDHLCRRQIFPPNRTVAEAGGSVHKHITFFRRTDPTLEVFAAGRNDDYIRSNIWTVPSVCNEPVTGSQALGSSHRLGRCCLWWAALPSHGIGSAEVTLILLLLLMVDSDDSNVVTLLIQPPSMQLRSGDNMIRPYSWILHCVRTLYGQMAKVNSPDLTCIQMIGTSVCYVSVLLLLQQFIRSRRSLFFRPILTFSSCLHGFLRDQNFQTDRIPLTDIAVFLDEVWAFWPSMNVVDLRNEKSGSADLLTSATNGSQPRVHDGTPQPTYHTVKPQTVLLPLPTDAEQQCRQLHEGRAGRRSHVSPFCVAVCRPFLSRLRRRCRSLRRLHLRLTVLSLCTESHCVRRAMPG